MKKLNAKTGKCFRRIRKTARNDQADLIRKGLGALDAENTWMARFHFEKAAGYERTPIVLSGLGYCLAREGGDMKSAFALCREAARCEPGNPLHHLHLGRVHLLAGEKDLAVAAFRTGLSFGDHPKLLAELKRLGIRRPPLFAFLGRKHLLNRCCGFLFTRLGLRFLLQPMEFTAEHS